jgi:hypothetical protein
MHNSFKDIWGSAGITSHTLNIISRWKRVLDPVALPPAPTGYEGAGIHSQSGCSGEERSLSPPAAQSLY